MKRRGQKIKRLMGRETGGDGDKGPLIGLIDRGWRGWGGFVPGQHLLCAGLLILPRGPCGAEAGIDSHVVFRASAFIYSLLILRP